MPEKKVYNLIIDPEFRDLIPPLNEEELKLLADEWDTTTGETADKVRREIGRLQARQLSR